MKTATFEIKVFKKGNYIYVVPTDSETEIEGFAKDVKIVRKSITSTDWAFYGFNSDVEIRDFEFPISLIKKENGDAYTNEEFKTWKEENTGIVSGSASTDALLQQIVDNTKPVQSEVLPMEVELTAGTYDKAQLTASYGNGKKLCHIEAQANTGVDANSKVAVQMVGDATLDWSNTITKGDNIKTIKGYTEIADFTLNIEGSARVYLTFFTNLI